MRLRNPRIVSGTATPRIAGHIQRFSRIDAVAAGDPEQAAETIGEPTESRLASLNRDEFPHMSALFPAGAEREAFLRMIHMTLDPTRFERGLDLLLDGIERRVATVQR